ncbi:hypothetical protein PFISCL1PPCAC_1738 [Pristionchus fissidentatus]|uniref:F-box domain-containing protein n=1 Tax=Pristionchus fissidentatus TaxID=1538716 RepID=A0AAV5UTB7_9BILA|nr:hypothetical protein PFISCL1PPCAC_1738 [Pristionchus fissidentatus]
MSDLNPDVLARIFLNLQFTERVRLETVCQLWHLVLQSHSCFSDMRKLNLADFLYNTTADYYQQESISLTPTIMGVVERCGSYVHSLSFGNRWLRVSQNIIDSIAINCSQLLELDLGGVILNADISNLLQQVSPQLRVLSLEETSWVHTNHADRMADMLCGFTRLESINLRSAMFSIENIVHLPVTLRRIDISHAHRFSSDAMVSFLHDHPRLDSLTATPCPVMNQDIMDALSHLDRLLNLELGFIDDRSIDMSCLSRLTGLRSLTLQTVSSLNETSLLPLLSSLTSLSTLSLRRCDRVFDYSSLAFCEKITSLTITDTMQLSDDDLILLSARCSLRSLHISNCINVTSQGLCYALSHSQFHNLVITHCPSISDDVMQTLAQTQDTIGSISIERCTGITTKGVSLLAWLRNIRILRSLDISKNRQIDDTAVISLHNALTLARRPLPCFSASDTDCHKKRRQREISPPKEQSLTICVAQTSVSQSIDNQVRDLIQLVY